MIPLFLLLLAPLLTGGDYASSVYEYSRTATLASALLCVPSPPSASVLYLCGPQAANATPALVCPPLAPTLKTPLKWRSPAPQMCGPSSFASPVQVRTAGYPVGMPAGATSCSLLLPPQPGLSLQLTFQSFRLNSQNFFSVQELSSRAAAVDPTSLQDSPYLLAAASGSALPPTVRSSAGAGLLLTYYAPEVDLHDPQLCDGVVAAVEAVPAAAALGACSAATSCGACASTTGCVWCDATGTTGLCLYTGVGVLPSALAAATGAPPYATLPVPPAAAYVAVSGALGSPLTTSLCYANTSVSQWAACPSPADRAATAAAQAQLASNAILTGALASALASEAASSSTALNQAFYTATTLPLTQWLAGLAPEAPASADYAASHALVRALLRPRDREQNSAAISALLSASLADLVVARYAFLAVCVLFLATLALACVAVSVKRASAARTGRSEPTGLEGAVGLLALCKALEYACLALLVSAGIGDVPAALADGTAVQWLQALAGYSGDAQYVLIVGAAYMTTATVPNSKHSLCAGLMVLLPSAVIALLTAALVHYSRVSLLLPTPAGSPFGAPLAMEICRPALPVSAPSASPFATAPTPVRLALLQVLSAVLFLCSGISLQTYSLTTIASADLVGTSPLHWRPPLAKALGSALAMLSLPVEVGALGAARCLGMAASSRTVLAVAHLAPSAVLLLGLWVVGGGVAWQLRLDASAVPVTLKPGLKLNVVRGEGEGEGGEGGRAEEGGGAAAAAAAAASPAAGSGKAAAARPGSGNKASVRPL